jgi:glutathione synthase/RimK-type ligase-like ATP-grasp enzyme
VIILPSGIACCLRVFHVHNLNSKGASLYFRLKVIWSSLMNHLFIVTEKFDAHADVLIRLVNDFDGWNIFRFHPDESITTLEYEVHLFRDKPKELIVKNNITQKILNLSDVDTVWWRKPKPVTVNRDDFDDYDEKFIHREYPNFLKGIWGMMANETFWVSHPRALFEASYKIEQLERARKLGFNIPNTIISNNIDEVAMFIESNPRVIYKLLSSPMLLEQEDLNELAKIGKLSEMPTVVKTTLITKKHIDQLSGIKFVPSMFQEYIDKLYELRITVVGDEVFCAKINSQQSEKTMIDFRDYSVNIPYEYYNLPKDIELLCKQLVKSYNLQYSAIDIVVDRNKNYIFLESNPNGQFYWVQVNVPELKMAESLANLLTGKGKKL